MFCLLDPTAIDSTADILTQPKIASLVKTFNKNKDGDDEIPCEDEAVTFFTCLGECFTCMVELVDDIEEDDTCESLEEGTFCTDLLACILGPCAAKDCAVEGGALLTCLEKEYGDEDEDEDYDYGCPDICEDTKVAKVSKVFAIA